MDANIVSLALKHTKDTPIPPALVLGIIETESNGNPHAARYEQNYRWTLPQAPRPGNCTQNTETVMQKTSWGLMQIMGAVAREHGFTGWLSALTGPEQNVIVGLIHLVKLHKRFFEKYGMDGVVAAYNAGSPRFEEGGKFVNQKYVDLVKANAAQFEETVAAALEEIEACGKKDEKPAGDVPTESDETTTASTAEKPLTEMSRDDLLKKAQELGIDVPSKAKKEDILRLVTEKLAEKSEPES